MGVSCAIGFLSFDLIFVNKKKARREEHRLINLEKERDLSFSQENGGFFIYVVEFLKKPSIAETFVDILLCAVPIWLAVIIKWSWWLH